MVVRELEGTTVTSDSLSQMPEASIVDLTQVSEGMQQYIRASSAEAQTAAMEALEHRGVMRRLFPTAIEREKQRIAVGAMRQLAQSKQELLALYTATQIEIAKKRADALIAAQGMDMQAQLTVFAATKIDQLNTTLNGSRTKFMAAMDPQYDEIERYKHRPQMYDRAAQSIGMQIDTYFDSTAMLLQGFTDSLNSRVAEVQHR